MATNNMPVWPGWETIRLIGRGSFGSVYEIERELAGHREKAAMKVITIPQSDSDVEELYDSGYDEQSVTAAFQAHLQSILREYSLMREMNGSANVVSCDDVQIIQHDDSIGWDILIRMELLTPLTKVRPEGSVEEQAQRLGRDMCHALMLCRQHGIIHRDIKPQNIFLSPNGDYKLGDFGIAKTIERTSGGTKIGTYKYMAPEVYNNEPYGQGADIYSLGLVLHWVLNERRAPFVPLPPAPTSAAAEEEGRQRRLRGEALPAPAHGSEALQRIVLKACAYDPKDRYQTADEMLRDLEAMASLEEPGTVYIKTVVPPARPEEPQNTDNGGNTPLTPVGGQPPADNGGAAHGRVGGEYRTDTDPIPPETPRRTGGKLLKIGMPVALLAVLLIGLAIGRSGSSGNKTSAEVTAAPVTRSAAEVTAAPAATAAPTREPTAPPTQEPTEAPHEHDWGAWTVSREPTCTEYGEEKRVCSQDPSHVETRATNALGHSYAAATYDTPATCTRCGATTGNVRGYIGELNGYFTTIKLTKYQTAGGYMLFEPVTNIRRLTMNLKFTKTTGALDGTWLLYGKNSSGNWNSIGEFKVTKEDMASHNVITVPFEFEKGKTIYGLAIGRRGTNGGSVSYNIVYDECQVYTDAPDPIPESDIPPAPTTTTSSTDTQPTAAPAVTSGKIVSEGKVGSCLYTLDENGLLIISGNGTMGTDFLDTPWEDIKDTIETVVIEDGVKNIGEAAFYSCDNLRSVTIPNSVTDIEDYAFGYCKNLASITIPSSVKAIGDNSFSDCDSLRSVTIPGSVTKLGEYAFSSCGELAEITLNEGLTSIGAYAFGWNRGGSSITIPASVTRIDGNPFYYSEFETINVSAANNSYCSVDGVMFTKDMSTLVACPGGKTARDYTVPQGVTRIAKEAFAFCEEIRTITLPGSVTTIEDSAFESCGKLTGINLPDGLASIGKEAFESCRALQTIELPASVKRIEERAFVYSGVEKFVVSEGNPSYRSIDGVLFSKDAATLINYPCGAGTSSYAIPSGTETVGEYAFANCENLRAITIPNSVTTIGDSAFYSCERLTEITLPEGISTIGRNVFSFCEKLASVHIPASVKKIDSGAFNYCSELQDVYYAGSQSQWDSVTIVTEYNSNELLLAAEIHYNA